MSQNMIKQNTPKRAENRRTTTLPSVERTKGIVSGKSNPTTKLMRVVTNANRQTINTYRRKRRKNFILYMPTQLLIQGQ